MGVMALEARDVRRAVWGAVSQCMRTAPQQSCYAVTRALEYAKKTRSACGPPLDASVAPRYALTPMSSASPVPARQAASRERVLAAVRRDVPDRIPVDYWADKEVTARLVRHFGCPDQESLLRELGVDLRYVMGPSFAGLQLRLLDGGLVQDHWGVVRKPMTVTGTDRTGRDWTWTYQHVHASPLERATSVAEVERYQGWPSADQWDYAGVHDECLRAAASGCAVVCGGDRLDRTAQLKTAMYLRGTEQFLSDLVLEPAVAECILEHIAHYYLTYNERVFEAAKGAIDIFFMGDDMGTQTGPWVSPKMYRRFFKERFRAYNDLAHRFGIKTMYHTCGNVTALVGDFVECGLDVLQSLQPAAMDLERLKREHGAHLAFQGGVDIQQVMPKGTPEQVADHVCERARILGPGGYIFGTAHNLLPDVPTENAVALFDAYRRCARLGG
jgi:uroporphyrinogen decarboxylase